MGGNDESVRSTSTTLEAWSRAISIVVVSVRYSPFLHERGQGHMLERHQLLLLGHDLAGHCTKMHKHV